jgi:protein CpxP
MAPWMFLTAFFHCIGATSMKSNRNWLAGSFLAAGTLLAAGASISLATAADVPTTAHGRHHHGGAHLLAQLNLSAEQQASVKSIRANLGPQMKTIHQEMRANSLKLRQTQPNDPNYANVVAQVTQTNGSLHSQMLTQKEAMRAQIFNVLTPAQQTQLVTLQAQRQAQRQARMQARGTDAPPPAAQ